MNCLKTPSLFISAVNQFYEAILYDMYVIRGNTAIFKCIVPSFVADYVSVVSWEDTNGNEYSVSPGNERFGIKQHVVFSIVRSTEIRME